MITDSQQRFPQHFENNFRQLLLEDYILQYKKMSRKLVLKKKLILCNIRSSQNMCQWGPATYYLCIFLVYPKRPQIYTKYKRMMKNIISNLIKVVFNCSTCPGTKVNKQKYSQLSFSTKNLLIFLKISSFCFIKSLFIVQFKLCFKYMFLIDRTNESSKNCINFERNTIFITKNF